MSREDVPRRVAELLGRPARWASPGASLGDYDGCERTLEVFNAGAREQRALLRKLRPDRAELERAAGGPLVIVFHTLSETSRLYANVLGDALPRGARYGQLADAFRKWMTEDHGGEPGLDPADVERFTFEIGKAA